MSVYAPQQSRPRSSRPDQGGMDPGQAAAQFQAQYGRAPTQQDVQRFQQASGWSGQGTISQQQYQQGMNAMGGYMQQEGNLGAVQFAQPGQPGQMQSFDQSRQQGQQLISPYQANPATVQGQQQAASFSQYLMGQQAPQYTAPAGQQANYTQQQGLINQMGGMQQGQFQAPAGVQASQNQQQAAINQVQGMNVGPFQGPEAVAMNERNRTLQAVMGAPDVFGAQQQAQMAEQQKEQLTQQARESENRLSQLMAARGLSARGGQDLMGQLDIQRDMQSNLLAGQRDIALRSAEANRAAQLGAVNAVTGAQQADMARAAQGFQTGLAGQQFNLGAKETAAQLAGQAGQQQFQQALGGFGANLQANQFNLGAAQAAQQAAAELGQQQFTENMGGQEFNLRSLGQQQQAGLAGAQLANQMGQQGFQNYLAQQGLGLQGFGMAEQAAATRAQFGQQNYMDALRYNLGARGQEQDYALGLRRQGATEQDMMARLYGFGG